MKTEKSTRSLVVSTLLLIVFACTISFGLFLLNRISSISPISDGGSHFVGGLLIADWLQSGAWNDPLGYAVQYFRNLPYIGLGLWPPLFHLIEALAFILFEANATIALILAGLTLAAGAIVIGIALLRSGHGLWLSLAAVFATLSSPLMQDVQRGVLLDGLVSALCLAATLQFVRHIAQPSWKHAILTAAL